MKPLNHETSRPIIARFVRELFEPSDTGFDGDDGYFRNAFRSVFDMSEPEGASHERPDKLIISKNTGMSFLGEFKASESDFLADQKKSFRFRPEQGMGDYRMYFCEFGIIEGFQVEKYAPGWGLGIIHGESITVPVEPQKFNRKAWWEEIKCLAVAGGNLSIECRKSADEAKPASGNKTPAAIKPLILAAINSSPVNDPQELIKDARRFLMREHADVVRRFSKTELGRFIAQEIGA